jgi:hypothetical protein
MSPPVFDFDLISDHAEMLHKVAAGVDGELVVCIFGEDPTRINPRTGKKGLPVHNEVMRFGIGDVEANVDGIMKYCGVEHANVYMPLHVVRLGLMGGARGAKRDIVAVLWSCGRHGFGHGQERGFSIRAVV